MHVRKTLAQRTVSAKMYLKVFNAIVYQDSQGRIAPVRGVLCNISSTRDSVSSGYPNTEKRVEITTGNGASIFEEIRGVSVFKPSSWLRFSVC